MEQAAPCKPLLPLTHVTGAMTFIKIISQNSETSTLLATKCGVYNEAILYMFYGRPAYRPFPGVLSTSLPEFRPICFLIRPEAAIKIARVVAFDSGAFANNLYERHHGTQTKLTDFEVGNSVEDAARLVSTFFGSNHAYYLGRPRKNVQLSPTDFGPHTYYAIISDMGKTKIDGRKATIEIQHSENIPLNKETVMAVALPTDFLENDEVRERLAEWECYEENIINYDIYHDEPDSDMREIRVRVIEFMRLKGLLK